MSTTAFTATHTEFDDEERHIIAPPACSEHHLHHHHHREKRFADDAHDHDPLSSTGENAIAQADLPEDDNEIVITASQKMLSACSGSLLTSLLG